MRLTSIILSMALLPLQAVALDYSNASLLYSDAPFTPAESAGISFLTNLGAVEGNPDGTFRPNRTLNRAEFLKIALASVPNIRVSLSDSDRCFPDVNKSDWFSKYVCLAEKRGIVQGYPDGLFHPERSVNYAEALKILGELYEYTAYVEEDAPWYEIYAQAAINHKTAIPMNLPYDRFLTRGQMARLASAYRAEAEEELEYYRDFERGEYVVVEEEVIEEEVIEEEVVDEVNMWAEENLPPVTRFLQVGERSKPIAEGRFAPWADDVILRIAKVKLERESKSIKSLHLVDDHGNEIGEFIPDVYDQYDETWKAYFSAESGYILPQNELTIFAVVAVLESSKYGGISAELIEVDTFDIIVQNVSDMESSQLIAAVPRFPEHQTVLGKITAITNALSATGSFQQGEDKLIGSFAFTGSTVSIAPLELNKLRFTIDKSFAVSATNWEIGTTDSLDRHYCSVESITVINCLGIPSNIGALSDGERIINLYASVALQDLDPGKTIQVSLVSPGALGEDGAVWWGDGTGDFTWLDLPGPLAVGTFWDIEQ